MKTEIVSYSHLIDEASFRFFQENDAGLRFSALSEHEFSMEIDGSKLEQDGSGDPIYHGHILSSSFLVALNIAAVGYFSWRRQPSFDPIYVLDEPSSQSARQVALSYAPSRMLEPNRTLTELEVERAVIIFGSLAKDTDAHSRMDYLKGLLHLGASHFDIEFNREAFHNFYRCMESFVTRKILGVRKLSNERKEIQSALEQLVNDASLVATFKEIYALRSSQVAHAQIQQKNISFDEALSAKAFADIVMYKTYMKQAEEWRAGREAQPVVAADP